MNLIEGLQQEMNRCRELVKEYDAIPQGNFGATMIRQEIKNAEQAIATGDTIAMMKALKELQGCN